MEKNNRICTLQGHEEYHVYHICSLIECTQTTRWCCSECFSIGTHQHDKPNYLHIMNKQKLLNKFMNEYDSIKKDYFHKFQLSQQNFLEEILQKCEMLKKSLIDYIGYVQNQIKNIISEQDQTYFEQCLSNLSDKNFQSLDDDKINQLLNINQYKFNQYRQQQLQQPLDIIKQQLNQIESIIKDYQDTQKVSDLILNQSSNSIIDIKNRKYIIQEIDESESYYYGSSISRNQQYFAYGGNDKILKIYNLKLKQITQNINMEKRILVCQFTQDSSQLYVGLDGGYVQGYTVQDDFKEIYRQQIHSEHLQNLIIIENKFLITSAYDNLIIKSDIKMKQQMFKLTGHTGYILGIDYDEIEDKIVSGSSDLSIKLWDCKSKLIIIDKSHNNMIIQIKFINKKQNIISLDKGGIITKWKIDLINVDLIQLQQYSDQNIIFNFYSFNQDQDLLFICKNYIKFVNESGQVINTIEHSLPQHLDPLSCDQLDNLNYIQIRSSYMQNLIGSFF